MPKLIRHKSPGLQRATEQRKYKGRWIMLLLCFLLGAGLIKCVHSRATGKARCEWQIGKFQHFQNSSPEPQNSQRCDLCVCMSGRHVMFINTGQGDYLGPHWETITNVTGKLSTQNLQQNLKRWRSHKTTTTSTSSLCHPNTVLLIFRVRLLT